MAVGKTLRKGYINVSVFYMKIQQLFLKGRIGISRFTAGLYQVIGIWLPVQSQFYVKIRITSMAKAVKNTIVTNISVYEQKHRHANSF